MTAALCLTDSYRRELETLLLRCEPDGDRFRVALDETIFYPEGGGQPADQGWIGEAAVVDVQRVGDEIIHWTTAPVAPGPVAARLDWNRRFAHMQQHTGQHLLTAVAADRFGWQTTAFHLGSERCDIELTAEDLSAEAIVELEAAVNAEIRAARPVQVLEVAPDELAGRPVRSRGLPDGHVGPVRLVEIADVDLNTCGGTHLSNTAEIQLIELLGTERIRGGQRLFFACGERVRARLASTRDRERRLGELLSTPGPEQAAAVERLLTDARAERKQREKLIAALAEAVAQALAIDAAPVAAWHWPEPDAALLGEVARATHAIAVERRLLLTAGPDEGAGVFLVAGPSAWVREAGPRVATALSGRGGGKGRFQGKAERLAERARVLLEL